MQKYRQLVCTLEVPGVPNTSQLNYGRESLDKGVSFQLYPIGSGSTQIAVSVPYNDSEFFSERLMDKIMRHVVEAFPKPKDNGKNWFSPHTVGNWFVREKTST